MLKRYPAEALLNEVVEFKPIDRHHINLKAPNSCGGGQLVEADGQSVRCQFSSAGTFEPKVYVCDDRETSCFVEKAKLTVGGGSALGGESSGAHPQNSSESPNKPLPGFVHNDIFLARERAKKEGKPILALHTQLYCPPCILFEEASIETPEFRKWAQGLVLLQLDSDIDQPPEIEKLKLLGTPTLILFDGDLREISRTILAGSPDLIRRWVDRELQFKDVPIADLRKRFADGHDVLSDEELKRLARWQIEQAEYEGAKKAAGLVKAKDGEAQMLADRAAAHLEKNDASFAAARRFVAEATDCQHHWPLWSLLPEDGRKPGAADVDALSRILDEAYRSSERQETPANRFDCLLDQAYLLHIRAELYSAAGNAEEATKSAKLAGDRYRTFDALIPGGNGLGPKILEAGLLAEINDPRGGKMYRELAEKEPDNYSYEYLQADALNDQKQYDRALEIIASAEPKARANDWIKIQRLKVEILVNAGRKEAARALIRSLLGQVRLPKAQPSTLHRFVAFLRKMDDKAQAQ